MGLDRYVKNKKVLKKFLRIIQFQNLIWDHSLLSELSIYSLRYFNLLLKQMLDVEQMSQYLSFNVHVANHDTHAQRA